MLQPYAVANQYVSGILVKIFKKVVKNRKSARPFVMFDTDTSQSAGQ
jgi:hypothetical protein